MFDQMSMPVLFAVLISILALVSIGVFVAVRVLAERVGAAKPTVVPATSARPELPASSPPASEIATPAGVQELD